MSGRLISGRSRLCCCGGTVERKGVGGVCTRGEWARSQRGERERRGCLESREYYVDLAVVL